MAQTCRGSQSLLLRYQLELSWLAELAKQQVLDIREDFATRRCNERFGAVQALGLGLRLQKGFKTRAVTDTHVGIIVVPFESDLLK